MTAVFRGEGETLSEPGRAAPGLSAEWGFGAVAVCDDHTLAVACVATTLPGAAGAAGAFRVRSGDATAALDITLPPRLALDCGGAAGLGGYAPLGAQLAAAFQSTVNRASAFFGTRECCFTFIWMD